MTLSYYVTGQTISNNRLAIVLKILSKDFKKCLNIVLFMYKTTTEWDKKNLDGGLTEETVNFCSLHPNSQEIPGMYVCPFLSFRG